MPCNNGHKIFPPKELLVGETRKLSCECGNSHLLVIRTEDHYSYRFGPKIAIRDEFPPMKLSSIIAPLP